MDNQETPVDYDQPVAYDANGQPLYAHPPQAPAPAPEEPAPVQQPAPAPTSVDQPVAQEQPVVQPASVPAAAPTQAGVDPELQARHLQSVRDYPTLNLSENEYVIMVFRRHMIGLIAPFGIGVVLLGVIWAIQANYGFFAQQLNLTGTFANPNVLLLPIALFSLLIIGALGVIYYVFENNRFYLTNESIIEDIQYSLFAKREQTISLGSIEDVSFLQSGVLQYLFNYGSIRLSTIGDVSDEDTYHFTYVSNPKMQLSTLNDAVDAFKSGRHVDLY